MRKSISSIQKFINLFLAVSREKPMSQKAGVAGCVRTIDMAYSINYTTPKTACLTCQTSFLC